MACDVRRARLLGALAALMTAGAANAQEPAPVAGSPARSHRLIGLTGSFGYDFGFEKAIQIRYSDGSTEAIRSNGGWVLAAGIALVPWEESRFETRATVGLKYDVVTAKNGSVSYLAFPLEVLESVSLRPVRLSVGASLALGPRFGGSGDFSAASVDLKSSLGLVGQAEWIFPFVSGGGSVSAGLRFLWQKLEASAGGRALPANALGVVVGVTQ